MSAPTASGPDRHRRSDRLADNPRIACRKGRRIGVCVEKSEWFSAVGSAYLNFAQVDDATITDLLRRAAETRKVDDRANTTGA